MAKRLAAALGLGIGLTAIPHAPVRAAEPPPEDGEIVESAPAPAEAKPPPEVQRVEVPLVDGMLHIPGGRFVMGSSEPSAEPNERPHEESVSPFWIDKTEVTVGSYRLCVERGECTRPAPRSTLCTFDMDDAELPITCVKWQDADAFCRVASKRLPREVEWEFAARGTGTPRARYPWGGGATDCTFAATLARDASSRTCTGRRPAKATAHPSGASPFGVLNLAGNAEEWTSDWYAEQPALGVSPRAGSSHVLRGGGWLSSPSAARVTARNWGSAIEAGPNVGFRCAKDG